MGTKAQLSRQRFFTPQPPESKRFSPSFSGSHLHDEAQFWPPRELS